MNSTNQNNSVSRYFKIHNHDFTKKMLHKLILVTHKFKIEERKRKIATLLAQSMNETEIAHELNVDQSTISRDVKALKLLSQQFVFDLAKSDLAYYYKQCIDGIEEVRWKGWELLLTDIYMPHMNGFELCEKIIELDVNIRVCFMSALEVNISSKRSIS